MLVSFSGDLIGSTDFAIGIENRSFKFGDGLFETMKFSRGKLHFWEDHYFRLMSSMRILRMEIPMEFSPEYFLDQINEFISANHLDGQAVRLRWTVFRKDGGLYVPKSNNIEWVLEGSQVENDLFVLNETGLQIELYKEHYKPKGLLANIKSTSSQFYNVAGVYISENKWDEAVIINDDKHVVESLYGNLFMVKDGVLITPSLSTGCIKGVMRKNILEIAKIMEIPVEEKNFSPFDLQRADEVFITNAIKGIQWVSGYRKKVYQKDLSEKFLEKLNLRVNLG